MEFKETVFNRRSNRFLLDEKIDDESINYILEIAKRAPVALGRYSDISLIVVEGETLKLLQKKFVKLNKIDNTYDSGLLIVVLHKGIKEDIRNQDAGVVGSYIALAASDLGLGSVYLHSVVDMMNNNDYINHELLHIEKPYNVMCAITIGKIKDNKVRDVAHDFEVIKFN